MPFQPSLTMIIFIKHASESKSLQRQFNVSVSVPHASQCLSLSLLSQLSLINYVATKHQHTLCE